MGYKKDDIKIGELYLQKGVQKIFRCNGEIACIDYIEDNLIPSDNSYIDRSGADDIYQLYGYDMNGFKMNQYDSYGTIVFQYDSMSLDEINKRFIKLSDYLKDADFVGREFRRTQPAYRYSKYNRVGNFRGIRFGKISIGPREDSVIKDCSYMGIDSDCKHIVLYVKDNIFLVRCNGLFGEVYKIIDCSYTCDGNYEFYGDVYEEYRDRDKVYSEIVKQIDGYNKKSGIVRVKKK